LTKTDMDRVIQAQTKLIGSQSDEIAELDKELDSYVNDIKDLSEELIQVLSENTLLLKRLGLVEPLENPTNIWN